MCRADDYPPYPTNPFQNISTCPHGHPWSNGCHQDGCDRRANPHMKEATNEGPTRITLPTVDRGADQVPGPDRVAAPVVVATTSQDPRVVGPREPDASRLDASGTHEVKRYARHKEATMEPELKRTGKGEWLLTLGRVPMLTPEPNSLTYGDLPPSTKTDVFVYADTKVEATLPSDLSPHVRIGIAGEGIDLFFMARHGEDALTALLRFSELLSKYAHALIDEAR